jgi:NhaP-type Na+/H+ or K+/H+ antiporter
MGSREAVSGAVFGAFAMVVVSIAFAWFTSGPDHQDWTHSAIALAPFAALFGAAAGAVGGLLLRVTRPPARRSPYTTRRDRDRREKRKYR